MYALTLRRRLALAAAPVAAALAAVAGVALWTPGGPALVAHYDAPDAGVVLGTVPTTDTLREIVAADSFPSGEPGISTLSRHVAPSCTGTGSDGKRVQVLYAVESGKKDRYTSLLPQVRSWVADVDDTFATSASKTARKGEPDSRRVRWVFKDSGSTCEPVIKHEVLPKGALSGGFNATVKALKAKGYTRTDRKYVVFADAADLCGIGGMYIDTDKTGNANDGGYASYARIDSPCWAFSAGAHSTAAHELMHMLGGVQDDAPHSTGAGHCVDETDVMCYDDGGPSSKLIKACAGKEALFDCRNDDYFNIHPASGSYLATHWNPADSSYLDHVADLSAAPDLTLRVPATSAGLTGTYRAVTSVAGAAFRWTATPATCLPGSRSGASVKLACPASYNGSVHLAVTASAPGTATARVAKSVAPGPMLGAAVHLAAS